MLQRLKSACGSKFLLSAVLSAILNKNSGSIPAQSAVSKYSLWRGDLMILVIEDNFYFRELLCDCLESYGFKVVSAADGMAGSLVAKKQQPELIISDIDLPVKNGFQVLEDIRCDPNTSEIPFIFYTGTSDRCYENLAEELGANAYLTKPLDLSHLIQVVHQQLQNLNIH